MITKEEIKKVNRNSLDSMKSFLISKYPAFKPSIEAATKKQLRETLKAITE